MTKTKVHDDDHLQTIDDDETNPHNERCTEVKAAYTACFNDWYVDSYLQGSRDTAPCAGLWRAYQDCAGEVLAARDISFLRWDDEGHAAYRQEVETEHGVKPFADKGKQ
eukprot:TRINITY_DN8567_c0_g2_i1.p3 TRINITY_DN8567_c0_g2~~TRINITY_DN8567_c0_g2_i1.p3  ORF type:complete len:109 (-),score=36.64 TRINITY_DN8567_c0_g2_i1:128-454(-)